MVHHRIRSDPRGPRHFVVCSSDGGLPSGGARAYCFAIRFYAHIASLPTRQSAIYVPEGTVLSEAFPTYRIVWCMASRSPASCSARRCPRPASPPGRAHGLCVVVVVDAGCVGPSFGGAQSSRVSSVYPSESYLSAWITNLPPKAPKACGRCLHRVGLGPTLSLKTYYHEAAHRRAHEAGVNVCYSCAPSLAQA